MNNKILYFILILQIFCAALLTYSLLDNPVPQPSGTHTHNTLFQQSIYDAAQENTAQDQAKLFAINQDNTSLIWQKKADVKWLKVLAWMNNDAYKQYYKCDNLPCPLAEIPKSVKLWVTLAPQLKTFCTALTAPDKSFRIKQYLGLDPNRRYETFVEFWVKEVDLFRPCPDPETNDDECNLVFNYKNPPKVKNIDNYSMYFDKLIADSYKADGAPWTRLGYTYDWSYGHRDIGASEYILIPNAQYQVIAAYSTEEYCSN